MDRRDFIRCAGSGFLLALLGCDPPTNDPESHYRFGYIKSSYLRPPGALREDKFLEACINCDLCALACDRGAITFFAENLAGKVEPHTPYIVAAETACDLCLDCTLACPTGALMPLTDPTDVRMGLAQIDENLCLPYINQGGCGACYTVCPLNAIRLEAQRYPKMIDERCVGCGLCEEVCLQKAKAIRVFRS